jgi:hypothetical protein
MMTPGIATTLSSRTSPLHHEDRSVTELEEAPFHIRSSTSGPVQDEEADRVEAVAEHA